MNQTIFISGAAGHLGTEIALGLAKPGVCLILNGRNKEKLIALQAKVQDLGAKAEIACFDVSDEKVVAQYFEKNKQEIHGLINNAYAGGAGTFEISTSEQFQKSFEVCILGTTNLTRSALQNLKVAAKQTGSASVINIASMYGKVSPHLGAYAKAQDANPPFYGVAKAGLIQLTRYLAVEFAKYGIRVNSISPGAFPSVQNQKDARLMDELKKQIPMNRLGEAKELVGPVSFLLSPQSSYVTGSDLAVDGGWTAW